ncbi:MAG: glutamine amidotransferase [Pikeienuella sp.]
MSSSIVFDPIAPIWMLAALGALGLCLCIMAGWLRAPSWALRALGFGALILALANPALVRELRDPLSDIVFVVIDETRSQTIKDREKQTADMAAAIDARLTAMGAKDGDAPLDVRTVRVSDAGGPEDRDGTLLLSALSAAAADAPKDRIAGAILVTDGQAHDVDALADFPGPVHVLVTGEAGEVDRRLSVVKAPGFGVVGEEMDFTLRTYGEAGPAFLDVFVDGDPLMRKPVQMGSEVQVKAPLTHGGLNVVEFALSAAPNELTLRNNRAAVTVNGVRDRLRVLLISGEPHAGERTWRNLLKADPSVDLVHFTILRPPSKQDGTPVYELSLIAFPTRELFLEKVDGFDLIIFDRYRRRGVLPAPYIANISRYVRDGGAVLLATGPHFAGIESLYRTPLSDVLPVSPTASIFETPYTPTVTELGDRHPVTAGLQDAAGEEPGWGRWMRQIEVNARQGDVLMSGADNSPLLVLDRVGKGRVAVLASDQAWLWSRGFEGGGPQAELLRRLAHWLMKEPELEEEALIAAAEGALLSIERRSVRAAPETVEITAPSGAKHVVPLVPDGPGRWLAGFEADEQGLHRLSDGEATTVAAIGPPAPIEFENPLSTVDVLAPLAEATGGAVVRLADGAPDIRRIRDGRRAAGRGWVGLPRREAYNVTDIQLTPLAPAWAMMLLTGLLLIGAWRVEGR